jgi:hypothetical protein
MGNPLQMASIHIEIWTPRPLPTDRWLELLLPLPLIRILTKCHASTQVHLYAHVQHIVVDLEEPRSLRPTIGWPASGAMHHPAYHLPRMHLRRTRVNKGTQMPDGEERRYTARLGSSRRRVAVGDGQSP